MLTRFTKMNGLGNDFIMIDDRMSSIELTAAQVASLCDRHFGIGADGIILVRPSERPECAAYMHYINADGTLAQMCGNGVRCFAKFLVDTDIVAQDATELTADTMAGPRRIAFIRDAAGCMAEATVQMGSPILAPDAVPVAAAPDAATDAGEGFVGSLEIASPWGAFTFTCVSMGNPHAVTFVGDWQALPDDAFTDPSAKSLSTLDVGKVGAFFESAEAFPEKANIEFAEVADGGLRMRVYERGCAETLACGTGACAVDVAAALTHRAPRANEVELLGGVLRIEWADDGMVLMTGPAMTSYAGEVDLSAYDE